MNKKSILLLQQAREKMDELSQHPVLSKYWTQLSLILKGSTSRGNADRYSDIDLVLYATEDIKQSVVTGYHSAGMSNRTDGVIIFFDNGHYHIESYDQLALYFSQKDFIHCWDVVNAIPLHDPAGRFEQIVKDGKQQLFQNQLDIIKRAYLDLQLDLDWMRMPIMRGDDVATFLHLARITQGLCRIAYLLDGRPYPPDKWVGRYLSSTRWGKVNGRALRKYVASCNHVNELEMHRPFEEDPLYKDAAQLIGNVSQFIKRTYGDQPWLDYWYNYV